ncbi:MAG: PAS domain S-box protein, partial [Coleofasciculus sp. Co-bin14]|nr:PAS domain S-box protein [Coleofasciculus sp. Co-bin14]
MAKLQSPTEPPSDAERIAALQARNAELELELQQLQEKLRQQTEATTEKGLSLLQATLEATADGIITINTQGSITCFNRKFIELWKLPESVIGLQEDWQLLTFVQEQLRDSEVFLNQVRAEYSEIDLESHSFLELKDGRVFERYSKPQVLGEDIIGRIISYRDITTLKQLEAALRQSEERFRATYEQAAVGIAHSVEGRFIRANQKFCDILGYTLKELQALTYIDITHLDDWAVELPYCQQLLAGEISDYSLEKRYIRKDGSTIWINLTTSLVREPAGEIKYATALIEDISDRKRIEEALRQSEERFSKAFRVNPAATTITTLAEGRYIDVNDSFLRLSGFKREEVIGKTSVELGIWVAERSQVIPQVIQQLQYQPIYDLEIKFRNKSGEIRDGITSVELIDLSGELCLLGQLYDVTDRKRTEAALNYRLDFEALLTTISTQFINLKATEIDQAINQALQAIGEFAQVDRACIFLISNERFFNTHQWFADGIPPLVYPQQGLALETIPETIEQLRQFKTIHTPRVADLPEPRKSIAQSFEVKSYIAVPIAYEGCLIGSLAFNSIRTSKTWSEEDTALL